MSPVPRDVIDADVRKVIAMARELAALKAHELAAHTGSDPADVLGAYAAAFGEAKVLLRSLAAIAERLMPSSSNDCPECGFGLPRHDKDCSHA